MNETYYMLVDAINAAELYSVEKDTNIIVYSEKSEYERKDGIVIKEDRFYIIPFKTFCRMSYKEYLTPIASFYYGERIG